jgi:hypothetical protein
MIQEQAVQAMEIPVSGRPLVGQHYLEVPVQARLIPQSVLNAAERAGVIIRDIDRKIY